MALQKEQIVLLDSESKTGKTPRLVCAGIGENRPRLEIEVLVHMRQVLEARKCGSGIALEGRVIINLRKREGFVRELLESLNYYLQTEYGYASGPCHNQQSSETAYANPSPPLPLLASKIIYLPLAPYDSIPLTFNFMVNARLSNLYLMEVLPPPLQSH